MSSTASLQGQGGGRIPMPHGVSYDVSRRTLAAIIDAMPPATCRAMHCAARTGDLATAQRLLREAAEAYFASAPAAPAATPMPVLPRQRRNHQPSSRQRHTL